MLFNGQTHMNQNANMHCGFDDAVWVIFFMASDILYCDSLEHT